MATVYNKLFDLIKENKNKEFINTLNTVKDDPTFDINIRDNNNKYFLSYAVASNNIELVTILINNEARLDVETEDNSLLLIPIHYSYTQMLELLLKADEKTVGSSLISQRDRTYKIPLHHAINKKNIPAILLLLKYKSNANTIDKDGYNSLFHAVKSRSLEICQTILPHIADINAKSITGENALHIATNLQLLEIATLLVKNKININVHDHANEITPLHYSILVNNKPLIELLIKNGAIPNVQDLYGNTPLHYSIIEENQNIFSFLTTYQPIQNILIFNLWNIEGMTPLHIYLKDIYPKDPDNADKYLPILIQKTNLNIQNKHGDSPLHYLVRLNLWQTNNLSTKKLDIFLKNQNNERPIDLITPPSDRPQFIDLVVESYLYILRTTGKSWTDEWDIKCSTHAPLPAQCKSFITSKIETLSTAKAPLPCYEKSYPMIKPIVCVSISQTSSTPFCTFTGSILDILIGLIYLLKSHKNVCSVLSESLDSIQTCKTTDRSKCEMFNFEAVWINKKLTFGKNFTQNFTKCIQKKRFVIIPLGIEMKEGNHANYLIYDGELKEIERFETYGGAKSLYGVYYNPDLLDTVLELKFKEIDENIKYIKPQQYLPNVGFQLFDIIEKKKKRISDPIGFCALWGIWWVDQRLTYKDIGRERLAKILIDVIKRDNVSFKGMIRNYSSKIVKIRDDLLKKSDLDINDWLNEQYKPAQYFSFLESIYLTLQKVR